MVSPEIQRAAITDRAARAGYTITGWLEGIDESGSQARSAWWPRLDQAVASVEAGDYDVILVWKFSRVARHRLRWAVAIDRVETAGGRLESATEDVDTTTSTGRFTRGMLAELQAFEAERIGEAWREAHTRRVAAGRPATGKPKFGYAYDRDAQLHVPDPETGPVLAALYHRYVAGEPMYQLVRWLNARGWTTTAGGAWTTHNLRRVLDTGFASGRFRAGGEFHDGVHEPLIDEATWQAYLDAREQRRNRNASYDRSTYLLSGMIRCARCGGPMTAGQFGAGRTPKYRCANGAQKGPTVCVGGYVMENYVVDAVRRWLNDHATAAVDAKTPGALADEVAAAGADQLVVEERRLAREHSKVTGSMKRLALSNATDPMTPDVYRAALADLVQQEKHLASELERVQRRMRERVQVPTAVAAGLLERWDRIEVADRRQVLSTLVSVVLVRTGRPRATVIVVGSWEARGG